MRGPNAVHDVQTNSVGNYTLPFAEHPGFKVDTCTGVNLQVGALMRLNLMESPTMRIKACVVFALLAHASLWAQTTAVSQVSGTVRDTSGLGIVGATVTITQTETGFSRSATTGETGSYQLLN